jgi:hypothetical protein
MARIHIITQSGFVAQARINIYGRASATKMDAMSADLPASNRMIGDRIVARAPRIAGAAPATISVLGRPTVIAKIAHAMMQKRTADAAENYLAGELRRVRHELQAMGVPGEIIKRELRAMEPAVRGELWRLMFGPLSGTGRRK